MSANPHTPESGKALFLTTRWTMVSEAATVGSPDAAEALEQLCQAYWFPLYAYVRRSGESKQDAEDITQGFFLDLLGRSDLVGLDREKGKFRSFLLASIKHYISNERDRKRAKKRGGGIPSLPLDWEDADAKYFLSDESVIGPEAAFDREWAKVLLERVLHQLAEEFSSAGKSKEFEGLKRFLTTDKGEIPYEEAAVELGMKATALRVAVHRLRKRYRLLLKAEIARTISTSESVEDELAALMNAFS